MNLFYSTTYKSTETSFIIWSHDTTPVSSWGNEMIRGNSEYLTLLRHLLLFFSKQTNYLTNRWYLSLGMGQKDRPKWQRMALTGHPAIAGAFVFLNVRHGWMDGRIGLARVSCIYKFCLVLEEAKLGGERNKLFDRSLTIRFCSIPLFLHFADCMIVLLW